MPTLHLKNELTKGSRYFLQAQSATQSFCIRIDGLGEQPHLPAGTKLYNMATQYDPECPILTVLANDIFATGDAPHAAHGIWVRAEQDVPADTLTVAHCKQGLSVAWVTLSDKGSCGQREDESGPLIERLMREHLSVDHAQGFLLPDDLDALKYLLTSLALRQRYDVICTTGGTGVGPRDTTPEATLAVIEKRLPGFEQAMVQASLAKTHNAIVSRAVAGTLGNTLIINLPGSRKAVAENLEAILPATAHTIEKLQGDTADCGIA